MSIVSIPVTRRAILAYPGCEVGADTVEPGRLALVFGDDDMAVLEAGSKAELLDSLAELTAKIKALPEPTTLRACISGLLDPTMWQPTGNTHTPPTALPEQGALTNSESLCGATGPVVDDPRLASCPDCIARWNNNPGVTRHIITNYTL